MAHGDDQHHQPGILKLAHDAIIPHAVTPKALPRVTQRLAEISGIVCGGAPRSM
jgi:hypothetical protein